MRVLVLEDNLMWSARLNNSLTKLGHQITPDDPEVAIVNLGADEIREQVPALRARGIITLGHAGHKEKDLHELGKEVGCDILATNGELTYKIEALLQRAKSMIDA